MTTSYAIGGDLVPTLNAANQFNGINNFTNTQFNLSTTSPGVQIYHFTVVTSNATPVDVLTIPIANNTSVVADTIVSGYCTAGTSSPGNCGKRGMTSLRNTAGTSSGIGTGSLFVGGTTGLTGGAITHVAVGGGNFVVRITAFATQTVTWVGTTYVYN